MKLLALILGFGLEHVATQLLHLRELRALDGLFDIGIRFGKRSGKIVAYLVVILMLAIATAPVVIAHLLLAQDTFGWQGVTRSKFAGMPNVGRVWNAPVTIGSVPRYAALLTTR